MNPAGPLKFSAVAFAVFWTGWMLWWSGSLEWASVIIISVCGAAVGYAWFRLMRWQFQRRGLLPRNDQQADLS